MLKGLAKAKALKEFKEMRNNKTSLKGLALAKALKRLRELRTDLGMGIAKNEPMTAIKPDFSILKHGKNDVEIVNQVYKQAQAKYANKPPIAVTVKSDGSVILVGWQGIKHALSSRGNTIKALATTVIEKLVENAEFATVLDDKHAGNKPDIKQTLLYRSLLDTKDGIKEIGIVVREFKDGRKLYDYFTDIKTPTSISGGEPSSLSGGKAPSSISGETNQPAVTRSDIDIINNSANNVKLVIDENLTPKERRKVVETWLRENLQGKTITSVDGKKIYFNRALSVEHLAHDSRASYLDAKAVTHIVEVLTQGKFIEKQSLYKERNDGIIAFHVYQKWVNIDNYSVLLQIKAGEFDDGRIAVFGDLVAYAKKIVKQGITPNDNQLLDGVLTMSKEFIPAQENNSIIFDSTQYEAECALLILQVLDENGQDITEEILGEENNHLNIASQNAYQLNEKPTVARRQKDNNTAVALMRELQATGRKATADEKVILSKYTGTGGNLVGENGLKGSAYEYYTPIEVAQSMWDLLKESGFNGGMVLDPSAGTGIFKASAPQNILMHSVELSDVSGQINALINDDDYHSVTISPFEKVASSINDEMMDAIITNVPFGDVSARGGNRFFDSKYQNDSLEEYFIKRSLDKLKPNGLAMFIVPTKMLDSRNYAKFRQSILLRADFLGAYRLPNKVFDATGADVTTDIIVLKKFSQDVKDRIDSLNDDGNLSTLQQAKVLDENIINGQYFATYGKSFVLGKREKGKGRYGDVVRIVNDDSLANILKLIKKFPQSRIDYTLLDVVDLEQDIVFNDGDVRVLDGMTFEYKNAVWQAVEQVVQFDERPFLSFDSLIEYQAKKSDIVAYQGYLSSVGRKMPEWLQVLDNSSKNDEALYYWAVLNAVAQALKQEKSQGYAMRYPDLTKAMIGIASIYQKNSIKTSNNAYKSLYKAVSVAFDGHDVSRYWLTGESIQLGSVALNHQQAYENAIYRGLANNWQVDVDVIKAGNPDFNPLADDDFCINVDGTKVTLASDYYHGNYGEFLAKIDGEIEQATDPFIKEKLLKQKAYASSLISHTDVYKLNYGLLSTMIPLEVKYRFFNEFVSSAVILDIDDDKQTLGIDAKDLTSYDNVDDMPENKVSMRFYLLNRIFVSLNNNQKLSISKQHTPNTHYPILTKKLIKYYNELNLNFNAWLKTQKDFMAQLDYQFNHPDNQSFATPADGSPFEIANFNPKYENFNSLHDYQFEEVRRLSRSFSGGCGFDVGLGKTATALATIQNIHNIGVKKRTFIVVPNHTISKWAKDIHNVYDDVSDVLVIGTNANQNASSSSKFNASDFALLATKQGNQYRKILMTVEAFTSIPMRVEHLNEYFAMAQTERKADDEKQKGKQSSIVKALNGYESKIPYFENMAVDSIVFDEAQLFKNGKAGGKNFNRVKGLSQKGEDDLATRALSARVKSWWVRGQNRKNTGLNDGVVLLTATPFTNSPTEIMTMLSLAIGDDEANKLIGGSSVKNMNDFLSLFANIETVELLDILSELVSHDMFTGFQNVQLLKEKIHKVFNIQTAKERGLKIPNEEHQTTNITLPSDDKAMLNKMKLFYKIANAEVKEDGLFLARIPSDVYAEFKQYQATVKEPSQTIGHAFSLISRMSDLTLLGADMALKRHVVLDFEPKQAKIAHDIASLFNKKKYRFETSRHYPLDDDLIEKSVKLNKQTGEEETKYKVIAVATVDDEKNQLILNVDDAGMLAILMRLVDNSELQLKPKLSAKAQALIDNVKLELAQPKHQGYAKQLIFCDVLSMHQIIKKALVAYAGIPASQIAILNAQTLPDGTKGNPDTEDVQAIQDLFADNIYTIIIANKKAETGIDLQKGTQAIHHLTTGWTPDSLQQRNGRGVRQGNTQEFVTIYAYNAIGTFDEYKRTLINGKADWISSLMDKNIEVKGTLTVNQELSEQDYEDLIEADSAEKIAELITKKQEREKQERASRLEAKNTFIFNNMKKAKENARQTDFYWLIMDTMVRELNIMAGLVRSNAGGSEQKAKRIQKAKKMLNQFAGLPNDGAEKLWTLVEYAGSQNSRSYGATISASNIESKLLTETAIAELNLPRYSMTAEQRLQLDNRTNELKPLYFGEDVQTLAHKRVKNIILSRIEMEQTTKQAFIENDDSELSRDEREAIANNQAVLRDGELIYDMDFMKFTFQYDTHYAIAKIDHDGLMSVVYAKNIRGENEGVIKIEPNERQSAINYMVEADFAQVKEKFEMSNNLPFSSLLPEVYNRVQQKLDDGRIEWETQKVAVKYFMDKATGRIYLPDNAWTIFKAVEQIKTAYYDMFDYVERDGETLLIANQDKDKIVEMPWISPLDYYGEHIKPFLVANGLKVSLSLDFHQHNYYRYLLGMMNYFSEYSAFNDLGIEKSKWATQQRYDEVIRQVAHYIYGEMVDNVDELVQEHGLYLFEGRVQRAIKEHLGELSINGENPDIVRREAMLENAPQLARENNRGLMMLALKDNGWQLRANKERLKEIIGKDEKGKNRYEWNKEQNAWYIPLDDLETLMNEAWFDFANFSIHSPLKYN